MGGGGGGGPRVSSPERGPNASKLAMRGPFERVHWGALMVEMGLTRSQFLGGRLEVSHLCHEKLCINLVHLVLEPHARNLERIHCRL